MIYDPEVTGIDAPLVDSLARWFPGEAEPLGLNGSPGAVARELKKQGEEIDRLLARVDRLEAEVDYQ